MSLCFDLRDPFPLLALEGYSHRELQRHSIFVDNWLGFRLQDVENPLQKGGCRLRPRESVAQQKLWTGLDPQDLQTPYVEFRWLLQNLPMTQPGLLVDLGCAYGRLAFVMARHWPKWSFVGYEYVGERVQEFARVRQRHQLGQAQIVHCDLTSSHLQIADAEIYFLYDFGHRAALSRIFHLLREKASRRSFYLVVRGRHAQYLLDLEHSDWLANSSQFPSARVQLFQCGNLPHPSRFGPHIETVLRNSKKQN